MYTVLVRKTRRTTLVGAAPDHRSVFGNGWLLWTRQTMTLQQAQDLIVADSPSRPQYTWKIVPSAAARDLTSLYIRYANTL